MTLRQYLALMLAGTALSWTAVGLIVTSVDPTDTQPVIFAIFYASLGLALVGTFSTVGFILRNRLLSRDSVMSRQVAVSFRQSVLLTVLVIAALIMQSRSLLTWLNAGLLVGTITLLEFFFISTKIKR